MAKQLTHEEFAKEARKLNADQVWSSMARREGSSRLSKTTFATFRLLGKSSMGVRVVYCQGEVVVWLSPPARQYQVALEELTEQMHPYQQALKLLRKVNNP